MGYTSGGVALKGHRTGIIGKNAFITFDDVILKSATFSAAGAMIYNASKGNAALIVLNIGSEKHVYNSTFELKFPKPTENNALILLA
jgi:predicted transcriptional regulator